MSKPRFEYRTANVREIEVKERFVELESGRTKVFDDVYLDGQLVNDTPRFWGSTQSLFGFSKNIFNYFSHKEVFDRISDRSPKATIGMCIEHDGDKTPKLLAVSSPDKAVMKHDNAMNLLSKFGVDLDTVEYSNGIIQSKHNPTGVGHEFSIGGDKFNNQFALDIPIDGYGNPATYLMLLRLRCTNGAIAMTPTFKSEINIGRKEGVYALERVLEGYNNEDGFAALRSRWESAQTSWASLNEVNNVYKTLVRVGQRGGLPLTVSDEETESVLGRFYRMTGDPAEMYGIANLDGVSQKKLRNLTSKASMYDLLNYITEVATHHATIDGGRTLQAVQGTLINSEYDLEGMLKPGTDWRTFWLTDADTIDAKASLSA